MPFPLPGLLIVLIGVPVSAIAMWGFNLFSSISPKLRSTHTRFALSLITERLDEFGETDFPETSKELLAVLRKSNIAWNSCGIEGDKILDGWGQPIQTAFDESSGTWTFRSPGWDSEIGTEDDIEITTERKVAPR